DAFEGGVTAVDAGLVLVGGEDLGGGQGVVVGDEGEAAIGCGVAGGKGGIGGGGQGAAGAGDGGVAGGRAGPAGADLAARIWAGVRVWSLVMRGKQPSTT